MNLVYRILKFLIRQFNLCTMKLNPKWPYVPILLSIPISLAAKFMEYINIDLGTKYLLIGRRGSQRIPSPRHPRLWFSVSQIHFSQRRFSTGLISFEWEAALGHIVEGSKRRTILSSSTSNREFTLLASHSCKKINFYWRKLWWECNLSDQKRFRRPLSAVISMNLRRASWFHWNATWRVSCRYKKTFVHAKQLHCHVLSIRTISWQQSIRRDHNSLLEWKENGLRSLQEILSID